MVFKWFDELWRSEASSEDRAAALTGSVMDIYNER